MSIVDQAKSEMARASFSDEEQAAVISIMEIFFNHWDSGGAVSVMGPALVLMLQGKPLTPLTGADDEWMDTMGDGRLLQNLRCGSVFKDGLTGHCNDIDAPDVRAAITFPYTPGEAWTDPVVTIETQDTPHSG